MNICYPFNGSDPESLFKNNEDGKGGFYPLGINGYWHSGVHLTSFKPVLAVSDGVIVAYRINEDYLEDGARVLGNETDKKFSNSFVLLHHKIELSPGSGKFIRFFSLYMHLLPWGLYSKKMKDSRPSFFNTRRYYALCDLDIYDESCKNPKFNPSVRFGKIKHGQEVFFKDEKSLEQETSWDSDWDKASSFYTYRFRQLDEMKHKQNAYIDGSKNRVEKDDNTPMKFATADNDEIIVFEKPMPIKAGEVIGYPGKYESENMIHMDIFMDDVDFMKNKGGVKTEDPLDETKNLHNWTGDKYFEEFIDSDDDGYCEIETLKEKIQSANNYKNSWVPKIDDLKELISHPEISPFLRTTVCRHPTEWSTKTDEDTNKWERLKGQPWNIKEDKLKNEILPHFRRLQWWDQVQVELNKNIVKVEKRNKENYQRARATGETRFAETEWTELHGEETLTLAKNPRKVNFFHPIKFIEHLRLLTTRRVALEVKDEKGKSNLLKKTFRIYDSEANLVAKGSLKKGKATTAVYDYLSEKEYFLWLDDEIVTNFVPYEGKVYCKYRVKEKDYLIRVYYEMGFEDYETRYNDGYKLKINGPEGLEGPRNIRRHGNPDLIHPNDNYYILLDQIDLEEIQPVVRRKLEEWKRKEEIKQLEKRMEKIIDEIKENQQLLADNNAKKRFLGPFEIMLPGETVKSYMEWIIDNWIEQEWLEDYSWKPFSQFVGLLTAPLPVLLSGYPALVDAFKTLQTIAEDIVEAGPKGRYLTAGDAESILEKYKMLSETLEDINIQLKQSKSTLIK